MLRTLALLLEGEFTLLVVIFVLTTSPVLTTLYVSEKSMLVLALSRNQGSPPNADFGMPQLTFPLFLGILTALQLAR